MNWQPVDIIALILVLGFTLMLMLAMLRPLFTEETLSVESASLIAGLLGSMLTIITIYIKDKLK
jgi:hypothetical protein